jgi:ribosome biogenesis GTPase A
VEELRDDKWDEDDRLELMMSQDETNQSSAVVSKYNIPVSEYQEKLTTSHIWSRKELVNYFKAYSQKSQCVVGFVGYPNVGKSSTINVLLRRKKCAVSSTPGKTKHMQVC